MSPDWASWYRRQPDSARLTHCLWHWRSGGWLLCSFPVATITTTKWWLTKQMHLQCWRWIQQGAHCVKPGCVQGCVLLEAPGENLCPCLFQPLETTCISWCLDSSSIFKVISIIHPLSLFCRCSSFSGSFEDPCDYLGPTALIHARLPISRSLT